MKIERKKHEMIFFEIYLFTVRGPSQQVRPVVKPPKPPPKPQQLHYCDVCKISCAGDFLFQIKKLYNWSIFNLKEKIVDLTKSIFTKFFPKVFSLAVFSLSPARFCTFSYATRTSRFFILKQPILRFSLFSEHAFQQNHLPLCQNKKTIDFFFISKMCQFH